MVCVAICYKSVAGKRFDHEYYAKIHMPLCMARYKSFGFVRYEIDTGLEGRPGSPAPFVCVGRLYFNSAEDLAKAVVAHGQEIRADLVNYKDFSPDDILVQISETVSS